MAHTLSELRQRFGGDAVSFEEGPGGLTRMDIRTDQAEAQLYLHGAHLSHWQPRGQRPALFMSGKSVYEPGRPIRGGVPIAFPWFGPKAGDSAAPLHGLVRTMAWEVQAIRQLEDGSVAITLRVESNERTRSVWPHEFVLRFHVRIGAWLEMVLEAHNPGREPFVFEEALHTYFAVSDVRQITVEGLADTDYVDKVDAMRRKHQDALPIRISGETDRVYLNTRSTVTISDPGLGRKILVEKQSSLTTVLWNPWIAKAKAMADFGDDEWPGMVCVETVNAAENRVTLAPGATHAMRAVVRVS